MESIAQKIFHFICTKNYHKPENYDEDSFNAGFNEAKVFFDRFKGKVDLKQKTVLDVGCGFGSTCIYMAVQGATKVRGIDIDEDKIDFAKSKLTNDYANLSNIVEFRLANGIADEKFDIVISKDCFQHYADPENMIFRMKQYLNQDGIIVVRFGPLWKSPYGGHINFMIKVPWVHLLFPESVIMRERKRFRPNEDVTSYEQIKGGFNKMTLRGYLNIIKESGLKIEYFKTNVSNRKWIVLFNGLRKIPFCREFFTQNVYSIMRLKTSHV
jgi:SAM-dependent methyltransferase